MQIVKARLIKVSEDPEHKEEVITEAFVSRDLLELGSEFMINILKVVSRSNSETKRDSHESG